MTQTSYALVTGASRGLGKYFARALAARQQNLVLVARDSDRLARLAAELEKANGIRAETLALDLASPGAGGRLAEQLKERGLKIDLLVNNAGFGDQGEFLKTFTRAPVGDDQLAERHGRRTNLQSAARDDRTAPRWHHQYLFDGRLPADSLRDGLFRDEILSDHVLFSSGS